MATETDRTPLAGQARPAQPPWCGGEWVAGRLSGWYIGRSVVAAPEQAQQLGGTLPAAARGQQP